MEWYDIADSDYCVALEKHEKVGFRWEAGHGWIGEEPVLIDLEQDPDFDISELSRPVTLVLDCEYLAVESQYHAVKALSERLTLGLVFKTMRDDHSRFLNGLNPEILFLNFTEISDSALVHLSSMENLTSLQLDGTQIHGSGLSVLKRLPKLTSLSLQSSQLISEGVPHIAQCVHLKSIDLGRTFIRGESLKDIKALDLEDLYLTNLEISNGDLEHLGGSMKNLKSLCLGGTQIDSSGLVDLSHLSELRGLNLSNTSLSTTSDLKHFFPKLEILELKSTEIGDRIFADLDGHGHLISLNLWGNELTDVCLDGPFRLKFLEELSLGYTDIENRIPLISDELRQLSLMGSPIRSEAIQDLCALKNLESLDLSETETDDASIEFLKTIESLKYLYLEDTPISARCFPALATMELLDLGLNGNFTEGELAALGSALSVLKNEHVPLNMGGGFFDALSMGLATSI